MSAERMNHQASKEDLRWKLRKEFVSGVKKHFVIGIERSRIRKPRISEKIDQRGTSNTQGSDDKFSENVFHVVVEDE